MQKSGVTIIFIIDTSGSMHDQKISSVNAALTECMDVLRSYSSKKSNRIDVGFITFNETMNPIIWSNQMTAPSFSVTPNRDGFYPITSFKCLYEGLYNSLAGIRQSSEIYMILITDGKATEKRIEYDEAFEKVNTLKQFRDAKRYAAIVGLDEDPRMAGNKADSDILDFLSGNDAKKRFKLNRLSEEVSKMDFFIVDNEGSSFDKKKQIESIFGE